MPINNPFGEYTPAPITDQQLPAAMSNASDPLRRGLTAAFRRAAQDIIGTESELDHAIAAISESPGTVTRTQQAGASEQVPHRHSAAEIHSHHARIDVLLARRSSQLTHLRRLGALFHHATHHAKATCPECDDTPGALHALRVPGVVWIGSLDTEIDTDAQGRFYVTAPNPRDGQRCDVGNCMYDTLRAAVTVAEAYIAGEIDAAVAEHWSRFPLALADAVVSHGELWEVFAVDPDGMINIGDFTTTDRCDRAVLSELWPASPLVTRSQHQQAEDMGLRHEHGYLYRSDEGVEINRIDEDDLEHGQLPWFLSIPAEPGEPDDRPLLFPFAVFADALFVTRLYLTGRALAQLEEAEVVRDGRQPGTYRRA